MNPYEYTSRVNGSELRSPERSQQTNVVPKRLSRYGTVAAWSYPLALVLALYGTWGVAWCVLGQMPRPSLDDPTSISLIVSIPYYATGLLLVGFPAAVVFGLTLETAQLVIIRRPSLRWGLRLVAFVGLWIATIAFMRWDPLDVGTWFMD